MSKNILLIGGCGYVGSALYDYLSSDFSITTVDLEWYGNYVNSKNIKEDFKNLNEQYLAQFDVIILLAGHSSVQMCKNYMLNSFKNNVENFVHLISKIHKQKFIYASSSSIYGDMASEQCDENFYNFKPQTYYDLNKQEIDFYAELSNIQYYGLRFGTVNGGSKNLRTDIMLNKMFETAKSDHVINIYNPDLYRPILGINDLCRAVYAIITSLVDSRGIYNLASFNMQVLELATKTSQYLGNTKVIVKGNTPSYNFSINTEKFSKTFNFNFIDKVEDIISSLEKIYDTCNKDVRLSREY